MESISWVFLVIGVFLLIVMIVWGGDVADEVYEHRESKY